MDALKYDVTVHRSTREAARVGIRGLRHEHVVPRTLLARRIIEGDLDVTAIAGLLTRCCRAAIVTSEQDALIRPRDAMPDVWDWDTGDPYARYAHSKMSIDEETTT